MSPLVGQLKQELEKLLAFMETPSYIEFVDELIRRRSLALNEIMSPTPKEFGEVLEREQEIGKYQLMGTLLEWFNTRRDSLLLEISASEVQITQT